MSYIIKKQLVKNCNWQLITRRRARLEKSCFKKCPVCNKIILISECVVSKGVIWKQVLFMKMSVPSHGNTSDCTLSLALKQRLITNGLFWRRLVQLSP